VLEAAAFQPRDVVEAMEKDSTITLEVQRADGGGVEDDLLMHCSHQLSNFLAGEYLS
jgi:glycerol kinase